MSDWLKTLAQVAPGIATAFGGPLAGMAVSVVGKALGLDSATQEDIQNIVVGSKPEDLLKLKQAENDFQLALKTLDVKLADLDVQDRTSARSIWGTGKITISALSFIILGSFLYMVFYMIHEGADIPTGQEVMIGTLIGYVSAKADQVVAFFFGSSHGSLQKNDAIADAFKKNGNGH